MVSWRADEATPERGTLRLMTVKNMSTGIEASVTGESLNSGDPAVCLLYTSPSPRDGLLSRMPSSA